MVLVAAPRTGLDRCAMGIFALVLFSLMGPFAVLHVGGEHELLRTSHTMRLQSETHLFSIIVNRLARNASRLAVRVEKKRLESHAAQLALLKKHHRRQRSVKLLAATVDLEKTSSAGTKGRANAPSIAAAINATLGAAGAHAAPRLAAAITKVLAGARTKIEAHHAKQIKKMEAQHARVFTELDGEGRR